MFLKLAFFIWIWFVIGCAITSYCCGRRSAYFVPSVTVTFLIGWFGPLAFIVCAIAENHYVKKELFKEIRQRERIHRIITGNNFSNTPGTSSSLAGTSYISGYRDAMFSMPVYHKISHDKGGTQ